MQLSERGLSFVLDGLVICAKAREPKMRKCVTKGLLPEKSFFGVLLGCRLIDRMFKMMLAALIASPHR